MKAERLLRMYPRAWRERYGEEFLETVGHGALHLQQVIDIVSGAVDAWLSADVRRATASQAAPNEGRPKMLKSMMVCKPGALRYTTRDGLIGAGVMLGVTLLFLWLGSAAGRSGWQDADDVLTSVGFSVALILSMPFWLLKGQPWKSQVVLVGGTVAALFAAGYLATLI